MTIKCKKSFTIYRFLTNVTFLDKKPMKLRTLYHHESVIFYKTSPRVDLNLPLLVYASVGAVSGLAEGAVAGAATAA
jgi:hypothetical protein